MCLHIHTDISQTVNFDMQILTISATLTLPVDNASAVDVADVGNIKANSVAIVTGNMK